MFCPSRHHLFVFTQHMLSSHFFLLELVLKFSFCHIGVIRALVLLLVWYLRWSLLKLGSLFKILLIVCISIRGHWARYLSFMFQLVTLLDFSSSEHFGKSEHDHDIKYKLWHGTSIDSSLQRSSILKINEKHHSFYSSTNSDHKDLTKVHCGISHIVNPQRDHVHDPYKESKNVSPPKGSPNLTIHYCLQCLSLPTCLNCGLDHRVIGRRATAVHANISIILKFITKN